MLFNDIYWPVVLYSVYHLYVNRLDFIGVYPNPDTKADDYRIKRQSAWYCNDAICKAVMVRYEQIDDAHYGFYTTEQEAINDVRARLENRLKEITG